MVRAAVELNFTKPIRKLITKLFRKSDHFVGQAALRGMRRRTRRRRRMRSMRTSCGWTRR